VGINCVMAESNCLCLAACVHPHGLELTRTLFEAVPPGTLNISHRPRRMPANMQTSGSSDAFEMASRTPLICAVYTGRKESAQVRAWLWRLSHCMSQHRCPCLRC
jgi:hypothetical protein